MKKNFRKFTNDDFQSHPVWEWRGEDGNSYCFAEPYEGKLPFRADKFRLRFVRSRFVLADATEMWGWTTVCVPPYDVFSLSPVILTEGKAVDLTKLAEHPKQKHIDEACRLFGRKPDQMFPLKFETDVPVPRGPARGEMNGFLHRHSYEDDKGWSQHVDFCYRTADELEAQIKKFKKAEVDRKAALEPSKAEKLLLQASGKGDDGQAALLIAKGVNVNCFGTFADGGYTRKKVTPLMLAAEAGHVSVLNILLKAGADIHLAEETNEPRQGNRTALALACRANCLPSAGLLLDAGASPNHTLSFGHTILDEACYAGTVELIKLLLEFGGDPNASCGKGDYFALERAIAAGRIEVIKILLQAGANIDGADNDGETALIKASKSLRAELVKLFLDRGTSASHIGHGGWTALHRLICRANSIDPEYDADAKSRIGMAMKIVENLIKHGADVNAVTKYGDTPLTLARECKFSELADYLIQKGAKG